MSTGNEVFDFAIDLFSSQTATRSLDLRNNFFFHRNGIDQRRGVIESTKIAIEEVVQCYRRNKEK